MSLSHVDLPRCPSWKISEADWNDLMQIESVDSNSIWPTCCNLSIIWWPSMCVYSMYMIRIYWYLFLCICKYISMRKSGCNQYTKVRKCHNGLLPRQWCIHPRGYWSETNTVRYVSKDREPCQCHWSVFTLQHSWYNATYWILSVGVPELTHVTGRDFQ